MTTTTCLDPLSIGGVLIDPPLVLAPMAGRSTHALRQLCLKGGACGLVTTALLSSRSMHYSSGRKRTFELFDWTPEEYPVAVQLYGAEPQEMVDAARLVEAAGATIVDINLGCWVPKVAHKSGAGAALLKDVDRATAIVEAVVRAVRVPVTAKIRSGWTRDHPAAISFAQSAEAVGVAAITIHARFADQGFRGEADWSYIRKVKETVQRIPVVGNGDACSAADVRRMMAETGCDGVMIGRAALGRPWLFRQIVHELQTGQAVLATPHIRSKSGEEILVIWPLPYYQAGRNAYHIIDWPGLPPGYVLKGYDDAPDWSRTLAFCISCAKTARTVCPTLGQTDEPVVDAGHRS
jgi:tRNA-dihydrouridine synthase B